MLSLQAAAGNRAVARTLTVQRDTGLAANVGTFVTDLGPVFARWNAGQANADSRLKDLRTTINDQLTAIGITYTVGVFSGLPGVGGSTHGEFKPDLWVINIKPGTVQAPLADQNAQAALADTVVHETRHVEQFFRVARMRCAAKVKENKKRPAGDIAAEVAADLKMDPRAVQAAMAQGGALTAEEQHEAASWSQSIPANVVVHEQLKAAKPEYTAAQLAVGAFAQELMAAPKMDHDPKVPVDVVYFRNRFEQVRLRFRRAFAAYSGAYRAYRTGLTFETDAFRTGHAASAAITGRIPPDLDQTVAALKQPWEQYFQHCHQVLWLSPPPLPPREPVQTHVQRHQVPPELESMLP
ncbi:hypothetical protein BBK82_31635 [Lentzea guizhouensis]|uniref:Uncharacterized protein n=1 Tax=Lentzea guizhouensis TaxID=1586287 RepID=A0A1B2HQC1_9PSEU|nr:hypothetical protein BBK82_31635 [Lentzea guizhouensis]